MKAFVKTTGIEVRKLALRVADHLNRDFIIGFLGHDAMVHDEAVLVFHHTDSHTQFNWDARFAFNDPFGVRLKYGKDFFSMRNGFALDHTPDYLVDLALGMVNEILNA